MKTCYESIQPPRAFFLRFTSRQCAMHPTLPGEILVWIPCSSQIGHRRITSCAGFFRRRFPIDCGRGAGGGEGRSWVASIGARGGAASTAGRGASLRIGRISASFSSSASLAASSSPITPASLSPDSALRVSANAIWWIRRDAASCTRVSISTDNSSFNCWYSIFDPFVLYCSGEGARAANPAPSLEPACAASQPAPGHRNRRKSCTSQR